MNVKAFRDRLVRALVLSGSLACAFSPLPASSETLQVPWECSNYAGDAQVRCVNAFMEAQQKKIAELEGKLQAQEGTVGQLKSQLDRQATATADLQRQLVDRPATSVVPIPYSYPYSFGYPYGIGLGFGLAFGGSGIYTSPYYGPYVRPFWGPRHYGYWGYRW
ncbi:MAG: hypothetical protein H8K03_14760 [Nitrospira sp.]|jgi:uncharacterized coiled-coil protein SlyX|nr:hypothetical protein [Nitrospira sp. BO4]